MDNAFLVAILVIFGTTITSILLRQSRIDSSLKEFRDFFVTLEEKDGKTVWGTLEVFPTGLELHYREPERDPKGHVETSYIFYKEQYPGIHMIARYYDDFSAEDTKKRLRQIETLLQHSWQVKLTRKVRNWIAMLQDAIGQTIGILFGQAKKMSPGSVVLRNHERELKGLSQEIVGQVGNAFEPILEKYIGQRVVLEITREGVTTEYVGVLKNYTAQFLELLMLHLPLTLELTADEPEKTEQNMRAALADDGTGQSISIANDGERAIYAVRLLAGETEMPLGHLLRPGATWQQPLPQGLSAIAGVRLELAYRADVVVPRSHAIVRHCAELLKDNWLERLEKLTGDLLETGDG